MEHYHGKEAAQQAMAEAHSTLVNTFLTLRCRDILEEIRLFADLRGLNLLEAYRCVAEDFVEQSPPLSRAEKSHVRVTLLTVEALLACADAPAA
jgi:hypothetical protein